MAACASMFSMKMIRILLDKNKVPFEIQAGGQGVASKSAVTRVAAKAAPSIVAMVDSFSELPKELQDYLLSVGNVPSTSADRVKGLILGGKELGKQEGPKTVRKAAARRQKS